MRAPTAGRGRPAGLTDPSLSPTTTVPGRLAAVSPAERRALFHRWFRDDVVVDKEGEFHLVIATVSCGWYNQQLTAPFTAVASYSMIGEPGGRPLINGVRGAGRRTPKLRHRTGAARRGRGIPAKSGSRAATAQPVGLCGGTQYSSAPTLRHRHACSSADSSPATRGRVRLVDRTSSLGETSVRRNRACSAPALSKTTCS